MIDELCADIIYIFSEMLKLWEIWSTPFLTRDPPPPPLPDNGKLKVMIDNVIFSINNTLTLQVTAIWSIYHK